MSGWALLRADMVVIASPAVAREVVKGLLLLDAERRRDGFPAESELDELRRALAALAAGDLAHFRSDFRSEVARASSAAGTVTVAAAARILERTPRWIRQQCADGVLVARREGHTWAIDEETVMTKAKERAA